MNELTPNPETRIALFQHREIRRTIHNNEWWFVITDVVGALTDSVDPSDYLKKMRRRDPDLAAVLQGGGQFVPPLDSNSIPRAGARNSNAGTPKASSGSSSPFPAPKPNPSNAGSPRLATSAPTATT